MKSDFINCKNCTDDCHCKGKNITPICLSFKPAKITNADRIRSMTDEELAVEMCAKGGCPHDCETPDDMDTDCLQCWLDWLKEEVTANDS